MFKKLFIFLIVSTIIISCGSSNSLTYSEGENDKKNPGNEATDNDSMDKLVLSTMKGMTKVVMTGMNKDYLIEWEGKGIYFDIVNEELIGWAEEDYEYNSNFELSITSGEKKRVKKFELVIEDGSYNNPYILRTVADLKLINEHEDNLYKSYKLAADIDLIGEEWSPIGYKMAFFGNFDGDNHTIKNLSFANNLSKYGFFISIGYENVGIDVAEIKNLKISFVNKSETVYDSIVGILASNANNTYIDNVHVVIDGKLMSELSNGGLLAHGYNTTIHNSSVEGNIESDYIAGGLVGSMSNGEIISSHVIGSIKGNLHAGGLVGYNTSNIKDSYAMVDVTSVENAGGLVGTSMYRFVKSSYAEGNIFAEKRNAGGLIGNSFNSSVTQSNFKGTVESGFIAGGIVGTAYLTTVTDYEVDAVVTSPSYSGYVIGTTNIIKNPL